MCAAPRSKPNCVQLWFSSALRRAKRLAYLFLSFFSCSATYGYTVVGAHAATGALGQLEYIGGGRTYLALEEGELALNVLVRGLVLEGLVERELGVAPLIEGRECLSLPEQGLDVARVQLQRLLCNTSEGVSVNAEDQWQVEGLAPCRSFRCRPCSP